MNIWESIPSNRNPRRRNCCRRLNDASGSMRARIHAFVKGRVQGVGFRYFILDEANRLGLVGYVRNRRGHRELEFVAEGERDLLGKLLTASRRGPPGAKVDGVRTEWSETGGHYDRFRIDLT